MSMICPGCHALNEDDAKSCAGCGRRLGGLPPGSILASRYEILGRLGKGGMGIVYKARDRSLRNEVVAIKVLRADLAAAPAMAQRFQREILMARRVSHRNVCRIHDYGEDGDVRFISMAFVDGVDLRRLLRDRGALPASEAFDVALQVADALQAIHDEDIVHRDLKTANLMRDGQGVVRVMDFGIAKPTSGDDVSSAITIPNRAIGTPEYMSPEQIRAEAVDHRSDIYALGVVVFELFTGSVPFRGETPEATMSNHLFQPPPLDGPRAAALPPALVPVLQTALAKAPGERFPTVREMAEALRNARAAAPEVTAPTLPLIGRRAAPALDPGTDPAPTPRTDPAPPPRIPPTPVPHESTTPPVPPPAVGLPATPAQAATPGKRSGFAIRRPRPDPRPARRPTILLSVCLVAAAAAAVWLVGWPSGPAPATPAPPPPGPAESATAGPVSPALVTTTSRLPAGIRSRLLDYRTRSDDSACRGIRLETLMVALEDENPVDLRMGAAGCMGVLGYQTDDAIQSLVAIVEDESEPESVVGAAAQALGPAAAGRQDALQVLLKALEDGRSGVRRGAVRGLARSWGSQNDQAVSALIDALTDASRSDVHADAAVALRSMDKEALRAVGALMKALDDPRWGVQLKAVRTLAALGPLGEEPRAAVPSIVRLLRDGSAQIDVRLSAASALGGIKGPEAEAALSAFIEATRTEDGPLRDAAKEALKTIRGP